MLLFMGDQYFIWRLVMAFNSAVLLGGAFYQEKAFVDSGGFSEAARLLKYLIQMYVPGNH